MDNLFKVLKLSSVVEVEKDVIRKGRRDPKVTYYIRKKSLKLQNKYVDFFGYNAETIKQLSS